MNLQLCSTIVALLVGCGKPALSDSNKSQQAAAAAEPDYLKQPLPFWVQFLPFSDLTRTGQASSKGFPEWFSTAEQAEVYQRSVAWFRSQAQREIRQQGTNAIPHLIHLLCSTNEPGDITNRVPTVVAGAMREDSGRVRRGQAAEGLLMLRHLSNSIGPELSKIIADPNSDPFVSGAATWTMRELLKEFDSGAGQ